MGERAAVSPVATAHPIKPRRLLESFLSGFSYLGKGASGWSGRPSTGPCAQVWWAIRPNILKYQFYLPFNMQASIYIFLWAELVEEHLVLDHGIYFLFEVSLL